MENTIPIPKYVQILRMLFIHGGDKRGVPTQTVQKGVPGTEGTIHCNMKKMVTNRVLKAYKEPSKRGGYIKYWMIRPQVVERHRKLVEKYYGVNFDAV